jgi:dipeptidyl aminopeptidase/acylaminoacyl peptidase
MMTPTFEQLLRVPHVDSGYGFDLSPDGNRMLYSWNGSGAWEIYESTLPALGGSVSVMAGEVRPMTVPPGGKFHPRYSPDGKHVAYSLDLDGSESFHIVTMDLASGRQTDLTPDIPFAHQPNLGWSPDGRQLAVLSDAAGQFALYALPLNGGGARLLLDVGHPCWDAHWSPDGHWIAVEVEWHGQDRSIFLVDPEGGKTRQLQLNGEALNAMNPAWSPDGQTLAFCADPDGWYGIGLYHPGLRTLRWLEGAGGEDTDPAWSPDGNRLVCVHTRGSDTSLRIHDLSGHNVTSYRLARGLYSHPRFSRDGESLLFIYEDPRRPGDLWQLDLRNGGFTQLTHSLPDDVDTGAFIVPEEVEYPSMDGSMVPAMLYRPSIQDAPALVNIHGGPNWLYQCNWHPLMSYLAARGWAVLAPNYRGSTGYGRAWAHANHMRLGEVDTFDCAAGAQYLVREKLADLGKILVSGRSHGGYLTMTCLTEYPDLWAGGSAVVPFMNWFTCHENSRKDLQHWDIENFGDPVRNAALWQRRSPLFYLHQLQAAVQLICSAHDPRCPASESIAARDRLRELGKQVELILYADEGHAFLNLGNVVDQEARRLDFLERMAARPDLTGGASQGG